MNRRALNGLLLMLLLSLVTACAGMPVHPADLWMQGKFQETVNLFETGEYSQKKWSKEDEFHLCLAYLKTKRYDKIDCPLAFSKKYGDSTLARAQIYMYAERAYTNIDLGDYTAALKDADIGMQKGDWFGDAKPLALGAAGLAHAFLGNREKALEYVDKSEGAMGAGALVLSTRAVNINKDEALAKVFMALGQYEDVIRVTERSKGAGFGDIMTSAVWAADYAVQTQNGNQNAKFMTQGRSVVPQTFMLSKAYFETGNLKKAEAGFRFLLSSPTIESFGSIYWVSLYSMGQIKLNRGEYDAAIDLFKKAVNAIETQRKSISAEASKIGFVGNKQAVYLVLIAALMQGGHHVAAFEYAERSKARALIDMLASKKQFKKAAATNPTTQTLLAELEQADIVEATQAYQAPAEAAEPMAPGTRGIAIKQKLVTTDPNLAALVTVRPPDIQSIQRMIPADVTLVEYYGDAQRFYAFLVTSRQIKGFTLDCPELGKRIQNFRQHLQSPSSNAYRKEAQHLYQMLMAPIAPHIKTSRVTIVPHGPLHYLPFNALADSRGTLLARYAISILPSASVVQFLKLEQPAATSTLVLGNPDLGDPRYDLPFAGQEAETIARLLPNTRLLVRGAATETAVKTSGVNFGILHFASHGTFDSQTPLSSGLLLAPDNVNDGRLTVGELYDLNLNAKLVTLSACETALGKIAHGDDVVGFTRGFFYAGASTIISSLWQVDDRATGELMQAFYLGLKSGRPNTALRRAQLKLQKDPRTAHPFYWAAFQMTGLE